MGFYINFAWITSLSLSKLEEAQNLQFKSPLLIPVRPNLSPRPERAPSNIPALLKIIKILTLLVSSKTARNNNSKTVENGNLNQFISLGNS